MFLVAAMTIMSCGSKNTNATEGETTEPETTATTEATVKSINADNWTQVVKQNFGFDVTMPEGWTVKSVSSPNGVNNIDMFFVRNASDKTFEEFAQELWNATIALDSRNNMESKLGQVSSGDQITDFAKGKKSNTSYGWFYYPSADAQKDARLDLWLNNDCNAEFKLLNMNL